MGAEFRVGHAHIRFCFEIYQIQIKAKRHFAHEHPKCLRAWEMPEVVEFLFRPEVDSTVLHICVFGMTAIA